MNKLRKHRGFTLVELIVVIAIMAILTSVSISGYEYSQKRAAIENDKALVKQLNQVLDSHGVFTHNDEKISEALIEEFGKNIEIQSLKFGYDIYYIEDMYEFELRVQTGNEAKNNLHYYLNFRSHTDSSINIPAKLIDLFNYTDEDYEVIEMYLNPHNENDQNNLNATLPLSKLGNISNLVCIDQEVVSYTNHNFDSDYAIGEESISFYTPGVYLLNYTIDNAINCFKIVFVKNIYFAEVCYPNNITSFDIIDATYIFNCTHSISSSILEVSISNPIDNIKLIDYFIFESQYTQINFSYNQSDIEHIYIDSITIFAEVNGIYRSIKMNSSYGKYYEYQMSFENLITDDINCNIYLRYLGMDGTWYIIEIPNVNIVSKGQ